MHVVEIGPRAMRLAGLSISWGGHLLSPLPSMRRCGFSPAFWPHRASERRCAMTFLEIGMIARRHETDVAHAMLHAVAVCLGEGSWYGWR